MLNQPDTRNALTGEAMFAAFETLFAKLNEDKTIRVSILTGAGSGFCSRGNIAEIRDRSGMFAGDAEQSSATTARASSAFHAPWQAGWSVK